MSAAFAPIMTDGTLVLPSRPSREQKHHSVDRAGAAEQFASRHRERRPVMFASGSQDGSMRDAWGSVA